ncbi:MAG: type IV toxin-antitoxin system AbiEi family antitoxin domain-containing protein [Lapillicoccus sp.]
MAFTREQALTMGVGDARLAGLVRRGHLTRLRRGVYARTGEDWSRETYVPNSAAALRQRGPGHVLSHLSAAALWDLPLPLGRVDTVHLTMTIGAPRTRKASRLVVHHADSSDTEVAEVDGIPVTAAARTVADCLRGFGPRISVPIADAALHRRLADIDDIVVQLAMQCHWQGRPRAEMALWLVDGRRESWLESYAFVRFTEWGVDLPEPQVEVFDEAGHFVARTDAGWLADGTVLELDGKAKYRLPKNGVVDPDVVWQHEKERYDRVGNLGLERVRFGLVDLLRREAAVRRQIAARRRAGSISRFSGTFRVTDRSGLTLL